MEKVKEDSIILLQAKGNFELPEDFLLHFHTHIYCHQGSISFLFNDRPYTCNAGEFVFWFAGSKLTNLTFTKKIKASVLLVERDFLLANIPDQSWSIDVVLHSKENPILHLNDKTDRQKVLSNFQLLYDKFSETEHRFYSEVLKLQMQLFILEMWHTFANEYEHRKRTLESGSLFERFMQLIQEHCLKEREVKFYANRLHITAKYLNFVCKQNTGITASDWIQRYARERIILLLQNKNLNISEVADQMNFSSRSFFTRYVRKVLGVSPREYRQRLTGI
ncbi:AraC family transcriptional regulator [Adhaeribacter rhizoryzae]|uniref:AraC family transcriptional regulator n=1 Tax=Adhaeribacter rhizoryzae TaxID=2607907 RepID=A0A5M6CWR7_9BACT|nr:AraC family transcriptional regulator [Adhaeribacter rhizoryzae]KAA5539667.1 AraC family transcriptional regulator [Adhaeribacter rhizoryzae]